MALAIFGGNLKTALEEGNMKNIWGGGYDKVDQTSWTSGSTNSNTVVSNTADLDAIVAEAKKTLDDLMAKPQPLSEQDARLAALNLTILGVSGLGRFPDNVKSYAGYFSDSACGGVNLDYYGNGITVVSGKSVDWSENNTENYGATRGGQYPASQVVENVRAIQAAFGG